MTRESRNATADEADKEHHQGRLLARIEAVNECEVRLNAYRRALGRDLLALWDRAGMPPNPRGGPADPAQVEPRDVDADRVLARELAHGWCYWAQQGHEKCRPERPDAYCTPCNAAHALRYWAAAAQRAEDRLGDIGVLLRGTKRSATKWAQQAT